MCTIINCNFPTSLCSYLFSCFQATFKLLSSYFQATCKLLSSYFQVTFKLLSSWIVLVKSHKNYTSQNSAQEWIYDNRQTNVLTLTWTIPVSNLNSVYLQLVSKIKSPPWIGSMFSVCTGVLNPDISIITIYRPGRWCIMANTRLDSILPQSDVIWNSRCIDFKTIIFFWGWSMSLS